MAASAFKLATRCWSSPQWCYMLTVFLIHVFISHTCRYSMTVVTWNVRTRHHHLLLLCEAVVESVHWLQALLTDMAAHSYVVDDINKMADEMIAANHSKTPAVKKRRDEINDRYYIFHTWYSLHLSAFLHSVIWHWWLGIRKSIKPVKNLFNEVLEWLPVWSEVQMVVV